MRRIAAFTIVAIIATTLSSAGFVAEIQHGAHDMHGRADATCADMACATAPEMPLADCIAHCLKSAATAAKEAAPAVAAFVVAFVAAAIVGRRLARNHSSPAATDAIAAFVRKRAVATVILRN